MCVEIQGIPHEVDTMELTGTFTTNYENFGTEHRSRNATAKATAAFTSRKAPYTLQVDATGLREAGFYGDPKALTGDWEYERNVDGSIKYNGSTPIIEKDPETGQNKRFEGFIGDSGTGWRVRVANNTDYEVGSAVLYVGSDLKSKAEQDAESAADKLSNPVPLKDKPIPFAKDGRTDYSATHIVMSPALWQATSQPKMQEVVDANGNLVFNADGTVKMEQVTDGAGNPVSEDVVKGGILGDLTLRYYQVILDDDGNPIKDAGGTNLKSDYTEQKLTIPGRLLRAALVNYTGNDVYLDPTEDYEVEAYNSAMYEWNEKKKADPTFNDPLPVLEKKPAPSVADINAAGIKVLTDPSNNPYLAIDLSACVAWITNDRTAPADPTDPTDTGNATTKYLLGFNQAFTNFGAGLTMADDAYIDVYGAVLNRDEMHVGAVFSTDYPMRRWNDYVSDEGVVDGVLYHTDGTPIIQGLSDVRANQKNPAAADVPFQSLENHKVNGVATAKTEGSDQTIITNSVPGITSYYEYDSAYRINVQNNTKFAMSLGGVLTVGPMYMQKVQSRNDGTVNGNAGDARLQPWELIGFQTEEINFTRALYMRPNYQKTGEGAGDNSAEYTIINNADGTETRINQHAGTVGSAYIEYFPMTGATAAALPGINTSTVPPLTTGVTPTRMDITDLFEWLYGFEIDSTTGRLDLTKPVTDKPAWADADVLDDAGNVVGKVVEVDSDGNVSINWNGWGKGYLSRVVIDYQRFNNWVSSTTGAQLELKGRTTNMSSNRLDATFRTKQAVEEWQNSWTSSVRLSSARAPFALAVSNLGMRESEWEGDAGALTGDYEYRRDDNNNLVLSGGSPILQYNDDGSVRYFEGYIGDVGAGWRTTVTNNSDYAAGSTVLAFGSSMRTPAWTPTTTRCRWPTARFPSRSWG